MPRATHHHNSDNQIGREHAQRLLTELWRLRSETHSAGSILKDASAVQALKLASTLFDFLAGWARDHVIGRELRGIPSAPYARGTERERSLGSERPWDDPELEHLGSHYDFADDHANQRILIELVHRCAPVLGGLSRQLMDAFAELQSGGNHGLVSPIARQSGRDSRVVRVVASPSHPRPGPISAPRFAGPWTATTRQACRARTGSSVQPGPCCGER